MVAPSLILVEFTSSFHILTLKSISPARTELWNLYCNSMHQHTSYYTPNLSCPQETFFGDIHTSYQILILRSSSVSAVTNQPCEAHWADLPGLSCNIPHNECILLWCLGVRAVRAMTLISTEGVGARMKAEVQEMSSARCKGAAVFCCVDLWFPFLPFFLTLWSWCPTAWLFFVFFQL